MNGKCYILQQDLDINLKKSNWNWIVQQFHKLVQMNICNMKDFCCSFEVELLKSLDMTSTILVVLQNCLDLFKGRSGSLSHLCSESGNQTILVLKHYRNTTPVGFWNPMLVLWNCQILHAGPENRPPWQSKFEYCHISFTGVTMRRQM